LRFDDALKTWRANPGPVSEVPHKVHFFWDGGALRPGGLTNVGAWGRRAQAAGWSPSQTVLWPTPAAAAQMNKPSATGGPSQAQVLHDAGVTIHGDVRTAIEPRMFPYFVRARKEHAYNAAADIARYGILGQQGGIYVDVDIGPGQIDLRGRFPAMARSDAPILGPSFRTQVDWEIAEDRITGGYGNGPTPAPAQVVRDGYVPNTEASSSLSFNNNFIVAVPQMSFFRVLNDGMGERFQKHDALVAQSAHATPEQRANFGDALTLTGDAAEVTGPIAIAETLRTWGWYTTARVSSTPARPNLTQIGAAVNALDRAPGLNLASATWVTDESDILDMHVTPAPGRNAGANLDSCR
jgi:hypothetical protein